jgi:hypothetical protein
MSEETEQPEKRLFVDEDWKSQVEAEREAARHAATAEKGAETLSARASVPLPPANLTFLVSTLYLQGVIALGLMPNPATNKGEVHLEQAKHSIDLLAMLQEKTEGNRTPEESDEFDAALHRLRLAFVGASESGGTTTSPN